MVCQLPRPHAHSYHPPPCLALIYYRALHKLRCQMPFFIPLPCKKHPVRTCTCKSNKTADEQSLTLASFVATRGGTWHEARTRYLRVSVRSGVNASRLVLRSPTRPRPAIARHIASRVAMQKASVFGVAPSFWTTSLHCLLPPHYRPQVRKIASPVSQFFSPSCNCSRPSFSFE